TRIDRLSGLAARTPRLANWLLQNRQSRWLMQKLLGISQARRLPQLAPRPFLSSVSRRGLDKLDNDDANRVTLFIDTFANYYDTELAELLVRVLEHNGVGI